MSCLCPFYVFRYRVPNIWHFHRPLSPPTPYHPILGTAIMMKSVLCLTIVSMVQPAFGDIFGFEDYALATAVANLAAADCDGTLAECACSHCTFKGDRECKSAGSCAVSLYNQSDYGVDSCDEIDSYGENGVCQPVESQGFKYTCVPVSAYCDELRDAVRTAQANGIDCTNADGVGNTICPDGASDATAAISADAAADLAKKQKALGTAVANLAAADCDGTHDSGHAAECACSHCTFMGDLECKSAGDCIVDNYDLSEYGVGSCDELAADTYGNGENGALAAASST